MFTVVGAVVFIPVVGLLVRRWRRATPALRRILRPVYLSGGVTVALVGSLFGRLRLRHGPELPRCRRVHRRRTVPLFFLAGLLRTRLYRAAARLLREVPDDPTPEVIQDGLAGCSATRPWSS